MAKGGATLPVCELDEIRPKAESVRSRKSYPLSAGVVPNYRSFFYERVLDAIVINFLRRMLTLQKVLPNFLRSRDCQLSRISDFPISGYDLKVIQVRFFSDLLNIVRATSVE